MAHEMARIIWQMAKAEEDKLENDLNHRYKKKVKLAESHWYRHVSNAIKRRIDLSEDLVETEWEVVDASGEYIHPSVTRLAPDEVTPDKDHMYLRYCDNNDAWAGDWIEITDDLGKRLIREAFVPLDLHWDVVNLDARFYFMVYWDHWPKN